MPIAARRVSENLAGAVGSKTCASVDGEKEHPLASLGHTEESRVENAKRPRASVALPIAEFLQATDERAEITPSMTGEKARNVLEEDGGRSVSLHKVEPDEGEAGSLARESLALTGDGEVLAGWPAGPEESPTPISVPPCPLANPPLLSRDRAVSVAKA